VKTITDEQVHRFLDAIAPKDCPWCGHDEWAMVVAEPANSQAASAIVLYNFRGDRMPPPPGAYIPTVTTFCTNCGGVREIARHVIEKWLEENENGT